MYTTLSMAISADGYMDDCTSQRLILSTPLDWQEVYRLRAQADAILVGGQTLRSDDPSLGLKSKELIDMRLAAGHSGEPMRVVVSGRGEISPTAKIFSKGTGRIVIFSNIEREQIARLDGVEVVVAPCLDVAFIVTELEKRGVQRLFVEGGAQILELFLQSGMVDKLRIACNPNVVVGDSAAPYFSAQRWLSHFEGEGLVERQELDGMQIISLSMG
ncbi:MAG: dihydrofolate reductase family protein, partial [Rikenellaceae bacterium]